MQDNIRTKVKDRTGKCFMQNGLKSIRYFVIDVDGTMTDTGLYYDENRGETKRFSTRDGEAIKLAKNIGLKVLVVTGRCCEATKKRAEELHFDICEQGISDKFEYLKKYLEINGIRKEEVAYIGDDINDLKAMSLVGFVACPADSCKEVKAIADYISGVKGGFGAVRDVIEFVLRQRGEWSIALRNVYNVEILKN